jgi:hypothetical protein
MYDFAYETMLQSATHKYVKESKKKYISKLPSLFLETAEL